MGLHVRTAFVLSAGLQVARAVDSKRHGCSMVRVAAANSPPSPRWAACPPRPARPLGPGFRARLLQSVR
jgi:hypothetical protein